MSIRETLLKYDPLLSIPYQLQNTCKDILEYLSHHGDSTKYQVEKALPQWSHGSIHNGFKILQENRMTLEKTRETWRTGKPRITYEVSLIGLIYVLSQTHNKINFKQTINGKTFVERHEHLLPLIFGKWRHFRENGVEDIAESRLQNLNYTENRESFYESFFLGFRDSNPEVQQQWWNTIREDPEIQQYCLNQLTRRLKSIEDNRKTTLSLIDKLENTK